MSHYIPPPSAPDANNRSAETTTQDEVVAPSASDDGKAIKWYEDWVKQSPRPETFPADVIHYYRTHNGRLPFPDAWGPREDGLDEAKPGWVLIPEESVYLTLEGHLPPGNPRLYDLVGNRIPDEFLSVSLPPTLVRPQGC
jgi:hypothetical protein